MQSNNKPYKIGKIWAIQYQHNGQTGTVYAHKKSDLTNTKINKFINQ